MENEILGTPLVYLTSNLNIQLKDDGHCNWVEHTKKQVSGFNIEFDLLMLEMWLKFPV